MRLFQGRLRSMKTPSLRMRLTPLIRRRRRRRQFVKIMKELASCLRRKSGQSIKRIERVQNKCMTLLEIS